MFNNSKIIGYTFLKLSFFYVGKIKKKYLYFDTLIIDKKFRGKKNSYLLMSLNNKIILNNNRISFLLCEKELVKYYKKFWWEKIEKKNFNNK